MKFLFKFLIVGLLFPGVSFATLDARTCSNNGYTIATINGILTDEGGAVENMEALMKKTGFVWNGQKIKYEYLLNPSHAAGLGDALKVVLQKYFSEEKIRDTDLLSMLTDASAKVKTQKLLLVAHSQGNFYANSFYDSVADKGGGLPAQAIGVYGVATPSDHVAGGGRWLTSDTDKVIAGIVGRLPTKEIMLPNTHIELGGGDNYLGHGFTDIYLKYRASTIVSDIQTTLNKLQVDPERREDVPCIDPPELTFTDKVSALALSFTDGAVEGIAKGVALDVKIVSKTVSATMAVGNFTGKQIFRAEVFVVKTTARAAVWTYNTSVIVVKATVNTAIAAGSKLSGATTALIQQLKGQKSDLVANQGASLVDVAAVQKLSVVKQEVAQKMEVSPVLPSSQVNPAVDLVSHVTQGQALDKMSPHEMPHLVFVGGSMPIVAAPAQNQVLAYVGGVVPAEEAVVPDNVAGGAGAAWAAPAIIVQQCASSLATDGCLLATTTVRFEWAPVAGASYYSLNKNGAVATTTDTVLELAVRDFSDYTLDVSAVGGIGQTSATSTHTVSVATVPIAINEIAWMGTVASANDEWIELKNNTDHTINLSQWVLESGDSTPHITLMGVIAPREYLVLERTDDTTTSVVAHTIYSGPLTNTGEQLSLLRSSTLFDQTPSGAWAAGSNSTTTRKTMERYSSRADGTDSGNWLTWGTNIDFIKNGTDEKGNAISGTPGARNSVSYLINKGQDIASGLTLTADEDYYLIATSTTVTASSTLTLEPGVVIEFYQANSAPYPELDVLGTLRAEGDLENPIVLESLLGDKTGRIRFVGGTGTSTLAYAWIESLDGVYLKNDVHLEVNDSQLVNNYRGLELRDGGVAFVGDKVVRIGKGSTVSIENTNFASTTQEAVAAYHGSSVLIASSIMTDIFDTDAIGIYNSTLAMASTTINRVEYGDGIGVYGGTVDIASSTISNVLNGIGMYLDTSTSTVANTIIENSMDGGISIKKGTATIASSTISSITDGDGIGVYRATVSIASSTIRDIADGDGIYLSDTKGMIANTKVENTTPNTNDWGDGVRIYGGEASIESSSISGFTGGAGIEVYTPDVPVAISDTEIFNNGEGISADEPSSVIIAPDVYIHDNPAT